jgi:N-acetylneuraminic acid mutarotase
VSLSFFFEVVYHQRDRKTIMRSRLIFFAVGIAMLLGSGQTARSLPRRTLTFTERVAYQYAIEEVYWRHRIWPRKGGENPRPKPALDEIMSRPQIEKKVEDYLRNSRLLADQLQRPITSSELQAEMDRMASHTKQPDVLRELFAALNNDPFVIAECLARPILADRFVSVRSAVEALAAASAPTAHYTLPEISVPLDCTDDSWTPTTLTNAPSARDSHTAVWSGSKMIIWGGFGNCGIGYCNTGGQYDPSTDSWTATSTTNAPDGRASQTAVWTGSEMIVWGGLAPNPSLTGGRYNPSTDSWTATSTATAPPGRFLHTAVWTGSEMIVWGGCATDNCSQLSMFGGRYNPQTDSWTFTSNTNAPSPRYSHTAVWSGSEMIVWGGFDGSNRVNSGGRYNPGTNSWTATSIANAPAGRNSHTAVWSGSEMIAWGGFGSSGRVNTGGRYNPGTDSWTATSLTSTPDGRGYHTAVWTGSQMIVWGGYVSSGNYLNTGGRYDPGTDGWTTTSVSNAPAARYIHTAIWSGSEMIVWGGLGTGPIDLSTGGRYCAQVSVPVVTSALSRKTHGSAGGFDVNLPLTGTPGIECRTTGGTNDYTMVVTFTTNVTVTGNPQAQVTLGTGCVGNSGACTGNITVSGNVVTVPLTNIANAQTINVRLNGVNSAADTPATNFDIPMSILIGDTNSNRTVNAADVSQTKGRLGQTVSATNFRSDVNANGSINAADTAIVKQNSGTSLPP